MKEERKRKLLKILQKKADGSKRKCTKENSGKTAARPKTRRIQLGLMSYDERNNQYKRVSLVKGGGTRKVDLPVDFNRDDVIKYAIKHFSQKMNSLQTSVTKWLILSKSQCPNLLILSEKCTILLSKNTVNCARPTSLTYIFL